MRVSINAPVNGTLVYLELMFDFHLFISRYLGNDSTLDKVIAFCVDRGDYVMLDNYDEGKGNLDSLDIFVSKAIKYKVSEVIVPDTLFDFKDTLEKFDSFMHTYGTVLKSNNIKICGVAQGKNEEEFQRAYLALVTRGADVIAVPDEVGACYTSGRLGYVNFVISVPRLQGRITELHMLGVYKNPSEIFHLSYYPIVRSLDTTSPIWCGLNDIVFDQWLGTNKKVPKQSPDEYFLCNKICVTEPVLWNLGCVKLWTKK